MQIKVVQKPNLEQFWPFAPFLCFRGLRLTYSYPPNMSLISLEMIKAYKVVLYTNQVFSSFIQRCYNDILCSQWKLLARRLSYSRSTHNPLCTMKQSKAASYATMIISWILTWTFFQSNFQGVFHPKARSTLQEDPMPWDSDRNGATPKAKKAEIHYKFICWI